MPTEHRLCHYLIKATAKDMAGELYEVVMRDNAVYKHWKQQCPELTPDLTEKLFIKLMWPKLIEQAKATLTQLLTTNIEQSLKDQIFDALIKDNSLMQHGERLKVIGAEKPSSFIH